MLFQEHNNTIWGTTCSCGKENYILQTKYHPWDNTDYVLNIKCNRCNQQLNINQIAAEVFYNEKIYKYFDDVKGTILDIGCGGGFLTKHLTGKQNAKKVFAIDISEESKKEIAKLTDIDKKVDFRLLDLKDLTNIFKDESIDYIVNRDVFMFVEDYKKYFDDISRMAIKGVRQMGWFMNNNPRMKNKLHPLDIVDELKNRGWEVELEILDWYKSGYFIKADK